MDGRTLMFVCLGFAGYHYQMKMHVFNRKHSDNADPTFYVQLFGAHKDTGDILVKV